MANVMTALKSEIVRLARKEVKTEIAPARKIIAAQRGLIADLRRRLEAAEKELGALKKVVSSLNKTVEAKELPEGRFWITGKGVKALRKKLGLTQGELAKLAGVSIATVVNWEATDGKISIKRKDTEAKLQKIRGMGKRAVAEMFGKPKRAKAR